MSTVNVSINLPTLPDNEVWWANNAAWQSYWNSGSLSITVGAATPATAGVIMQASTLIYAPGLTTNQDFLDLVVDGAPYVLPTQTNYNELKASFNKLNTDYQQLKTALKAGGIITNA